MNKSVSEVESDSPVALSPRGFPLKPVRIEDLHNNPLDWVNDANPKTGIGHLPVAYLEIGGKLHQIFLTVWYRRADTNYAVWMLGVKQVWRGANDLALIEDTLQPVATYDVSLESVAGDLLAAPESVCNVEPVDLVVIEDRFTLTHKGNQLAKMLNNPARIELTAKARALLQSEVAS